MPGRTQTARRYWAARRAVARRVRGGGHEVFWTRYGDMAGSLVDFLASNRMSVHGQQLAVLGCGDGAVTLGVAHAVRPALLLGFDTVAPKSESLLATAREAGVAGDMPPGLHFESYTADGIPAPDATFDVALVAASWSDFSDLVRPIAETRRVLKPGGAIALMLSREWPGRSGMAKENPLGAPSLEEVQGVVLAGGLDLAAVTLDAPLTTVRAEQSWIALPTLAVRSVAVLARAPVVSPGSLLTP